MAHIDRKLYWKIFWALLILTILEVGVVYVPGIDKVLLGIALVSMALVKATLVGLFYMHLSHDTKELRLAIAIPMMIPGFYALVLISEATWRLVF